MRIPGTLALLLIASTATADNSMARDGQLLKTYTGSLHTETRSGDTCRVLQGNDGLRYAILGLDGADPPPVTSIRGQLVRLASPRCGTLLGILIPPGSQPDATGRPAVIQGVVRRQNMEGSCWTLLTRNGDQYQLKGGDQNMYRDGQFVRVPANDMDGQAGSNCGSDTVLRVHNYVVLEAGLQQGGYAINRRVTSSTLRD